MNSSQSSDAGTFVETTWPINDGSGRISVNALVCAEYQQLDEKKVCDKQLVTLSTSKGPVQVEITMKITQINGIPNLHPVPPVPLTLQERMRASRSPVRAKQATWVSQQLSPDGHWAPPTCNCEVKMQKFTASTGLEYYRCLASVCQGVILASLWDEACADKADREKNGAHPIVKDASNNYPPPICACGIKRELFMKNDGSSFHYRCIQRICQGVVALNQWNNAQAEKAAQA
jgi:hypothetical protein